MLNKCPRTQGGKGNFGKFVERGGKICAAGLPSSQPDQNVPDALQHYLLKDEVDALLSDTIQPPPKPRDLPPLRHPVPLDKRHGGTFSDVAQIVFPENRSKFQTLVDDLKESQYKSYWTKALGQVKDPVPMFPEGYDINGTTYGKKLPYDGPLYEIVMPKVPLPDKTPASKKPGAQTDRKYCKPAFDPDLTYGYRSHVNKRGKYAKCCLTDDRVIQGTAERTINNFTLTDFKTEKQPRMGTVLTPNNNINCVPKGYAFGKVDPPENIQESLIFCELNPGQAEFRKCLAHLNSFRKVISKRYLPTFFRTFYLNLKYYDKDSTGWLPKDVLYDYCASKHLRFDPVYIEPLLSMWNVFDGSRIKYKMFVHILNYKRPLPTIPKIPDVPDNCLDYRTTYTEMTKPNQKQDRAFMAGVPSGRYFDKDFPVTPDYYCKALRFYLPDESDMKSCLCPSILTQLGVSHRDMFEKRQPHIVRRVFEASGETFTDEEFNQIWEDAKKYHSQGWVCYETFRRALKEKQH